MVNGIGGAIVKRSQTFVAKLVVAGLILATGLAQPALSQPGGQAAEAFADAPPQVGEMAPDFSRRNLEGAEMILGELCKDKPIVLEFGSLSCPQFRARAPQMERLAGALGDRAQCLLVYTLEAHPQDVNSPYANRVWVHPKNEDEGVLVDQPTTYEQRVALATKAVEDLGISFPVLVDGMDNAVWEAYGKRPNSAFIIDKGGTVSSKQFWCNPRELFAQLRGGARPGEGRADRQPHQIDAEGVAIERDIEYGNVDGYSLKLDAYLPEEGGPHPVLVCIHGGGWRSGDKGGFAREGIRYAQDGIATFSLNYRLSDVARYPAAVDDCVAAMRFIRTNAERFGIDADRIAVKGGSAGAHLSLMMAFLEPDDDEVNANGEPIGNRVVCVVAQSGPTDLTATDEMKSERLLVAFMGGPYEENKERYEQASPVTHLSADDPPALLLHGDVDRTVPYTQAVILRDRMEEMGLSVELITIEGGGHGGFKGGEREDILAARQRADEFIRRHLLATE